MWIIVYMLHNFMNILCMFDQSLVHNTHFNNQSHIYSLLPSINTPVDMLDMLFHSYMLNMVEYMVYRNYYYLYMSLQDNHSNTWNCINMSYPHMFYNLILIYMFYNYFHMDCIYYLRYLYRIQMDIQINRFCCISNQLNM